MLKTDWVRPAVILLLLTSASAAQVNLSGKQIRGGGQNARLIGQPVKLARAGFILSAQCNGDGFWIEGPQGVQKFASARQALNYRLAPGTYRVFPNLRPGQQEASVGLQIGTAQAASSSQNLSSGETTSGSRSAPNCQGDPFTGGSWCSSQGGADWLQRGFGSIYRVDQISIGVAGTDVSTDRSSLELLLQAPDGQWVQIDKLSDTNINMSRLTGGAKAHSIASYTRRLSPPIAATAFRLNFQGHGWFVAQNIAITGQRIGPEASRPPESRPPSHNLSGAWRSSAGVVLNIQDNGSNLTGNSDSGPFTHALTAQWSNGSYVGSVARVNKSNGASCNLYVKLTPIDSNQFDWETTGTDGTADLPRNFVEHFTYRRI